MILQSEIVLILSHFETNNNKKKVKEPFDFRTTLFFSRFFYEKIWDFAAFKKSFLTVEFGKHQQKYGN